jgi:hypothetical protein
MVLGAELEGAGLAQGKLGPFREAVAVIGNEIDAVQAFGEFFSCQGMVHKQKTAAGATASGNR